MRIPTSKVYRAFPELDRFSDEVCEQYLAYVLGRYGRVMRMTVRGMWIACVGASCLITPWAAHLGHRFAYVLARWGFSGSNLWMFGAAGVIAAVSLGLMLSVLLLRDWMLRSLLRVRIIEARCPACSYSLLGLTVDREGIVVCPECGVRSLLPERSLTAQDVLGNVEFGGSAPGSLERD